MYDTNTGRRLDRCIVHANSILGLFRGLDSHSAGIPDKCQVPCDDRRMLQAATDWISGLYSHGKLQTHVTRMVRLSPGPMWGILEDAQKHWLQRGSPGDRPQQPSATNRP